MSSETVDDVGGPDGGSVGGAVQRVRDAVAALGAVDLRLMGAADRAELVRSVEVASRELAAVQVAQVGAIDVGGLHQCDGHRSAAVMVRHVCRVSSAEARWRHRTARALRDLPLTAAAFAAGEVGVCQVRRLVRVWANPRVRDLLVVAEADLLAIARDEPYTWFDAAITRWERDADVDGTIDRDSVAEKASLRRELDGTWRFEATLRSGTGAVLEEIFRHYCDAELAADWDRARANSGEAATWADLERSDPQRRADALKALFFDAAGAPADGAEARVRIDLVMPYDRFRAELEILAGATRDQSGISVTERLVRCGTVAGTWIDPWDVARLSVGAELRRVVVGADGAVIELGRSNRFFRGSARDAVMLRHPECVWAGCETSVSRCQADHVIPWSEGGRTDPANGTPQCGHHNRRKNHRFRVWCDPGGRWHTYRPDGTEI